MLIIGAHKCGTMSLQKYYEAKGNEVIRNTQLFTRWDGPDVYKRKYKDYLPVVILRDPVERAWADYHHRLRRDMINERIFHNYEEYCKNQMDDGPTMGYLSLGELNIIEISKYQQWLDNWHDINPLALSLEEMRYDDDFPKVNSGGIYAEMKDETYQFTKRLINEIS